MTDDRHSVVVLTPLIDRRASLRQLGLATAAYAPLAVVMFVWPGMVASVAQRCGQPPVDVRAFWDADDARSLVAAIRRKIRRMDRR